MTLGDAKPGQKLIVNSIMSGRGAYRRLLDLGIKPGSDIEVLACHPFGGAILLKSMETEIAVGRKLAYQIQVRLKKPAKKG